MCLCHSKTAIARGGIPYVNNIVFTKTFTHFCEFQSIQKALFSMLDDSKIYVSKTSATHFNVEFNDS